MSQALKTAQQKAEATYNAAAADFDGPGFWDRYGRRTVERLALPAGARVLDVCCGTGSSAIPAAEAVGPGGQVIAVDLADRMLEIGRAKAAAAGLRSVEFRRADMTALGFPDGHFDAVVSVFGIFFVPDMEAQLAELWRMVRPGGRLAVTTWGPDIFAPAYEVWLSSVRRVRPDLQNAFNPWDRVTTPAAVTRLFADAGIPAVDVVAEAGHQALRTPDDFWLVVLGSGLRWTLEEMGPGPAAAVKGEVLATLAARGVERIATNVLYAVAVKEGRR